MRISLTSELRSDEIRALLRELEHPRHFSRELIIGTGMQIAGGSLVAQFQVVRIHGLPDLLGLFDDFLLQPTAGTSRNVRSLPERVLIQRDQIRCGAECASC